MSFVIRCIDLSGYAMHSNGRSPAGLMLRSYDPEAHDGLGLADWTRYPEDAMMFETAFAAFQLWRTVPENRPTRPDGRPNRPLTAFTVEIINLEEVV